MKTHDLKDDIGYWLNRLRIHVHHGFEEKLSAYDISIAQWCIMQTLYNHKLSSVTELSKIIEVDKGAISRVVDKLLARGMVTHAQGNDRRSGRIQLTSQACELVPKLIEAAQENEREFFGHLSVQETEQLQIIFHKIMRNIPSIHLSGWLSNPKE